MDLQKIIRFMLILVVYNLIICTIAFITKYTLRLLNVDFSEWGNIDWWMLYSIYAFIGVLMLYLTPYFEKVLRQKLENVLKKLEFKEL